MRVVITMAGEGSRFKQIGIAKPKYEIVANGKTLFEWSLSGLKSFHSVCEFIFVARQNSSFFITDACRNLGIKHFIIIELNAMTSGQAETVYKALCSSKEDSSILIFNIDTYLNLPADSLNMKSFSNADGWLQLFKAPGDHWSFAKLNNQGEVIEVTEKIRISEFASTGLYYFSSSDFYIKNYEEHCEEVRAKFKETYIAPFYQYMILGGKKIMQQTIPFENVIPLGTPDEVAAFDSEYLKGLM